MIDVTQRRLKDILSYDTNTGIFTWLVARGGVVVGSQAGNCHHSGYVFISIDSRLHAAHRLAWLYVNGSTPEGQIDHINSVRSDNRIGNLRDVSRLENLKNKQKYSNNTSGVCGVYYTGETNPWRAIITVDGKTISLGLHSQFWDAVCARKSAEYKYGFHDNHGMTK